MFFPEPIKPRKVWSQVIAQQNEDFGLQVNPLHDNCTQRDFKSTLQETVDRDAALIPDDLDELDVAIGLDGFDSYCHVLLRLVNYKDGTAVESEQKGAGLAVAVGDDHNPNLDLIFGAGLGRDINGAIKNGATVQLHGRAVPIKIIGCFDLSAARSVKARRTNASPWSNALVPELIINANQDADMDAIEKLILEKMPLLGEGGEEEEAKLSHFASSFPWSCSRCDYMVADQQEEDDNVAEMKEARSAKSKKGRGAGEAGGEARRGARPVHGVPADHPRARPIREPRRPAARDRHQPAGEDHEVLLSRPGAPRLRPRHAGADRCLLRAHRLRTRPTAEG